MIFLRLFSKLAPIVLTLGFVGILLATCGTSHDAPQHSTSSPAKEPTRAIASSFQTTLKTSDGLLLLQLSITPNRLGKNVFFVDVKSASTSKPVANEQVQIFTTMLDMDMATGVIIFQSDGNGRYSAQGDFPMDGNWEIHIQLLDGAVHVAKLKMSIPA